jgi:DNA-binding CsgD family transcriptional regulator
MSDENTTGDSNGRYPSVLASLPILVSTHALDGEGTYTGVYTSLQVKSTGAPEELVGSALSDVLNDEATEKLLSCADEAVETGTRQYAEFPVYFAGEEFWRGAYVSPLSSETDEVVVAGFDLTRHHEREKLLYDVLDALVTYTSRRDLERAFCECLVERSRYCMAWIGEPDCDADSDGDGEVEVRASAGADGYLEDLAERFDSLEEADEPGVRAVSSCGSSETFTVDSTEDWAEIAEEHGAQAGAVFPLSHRGVEHGFLVLYTTDAEYLVPWREGVLADYADAVGYALSAAMWRWALTAETAAVVDIGLYDSALSELCDAAGCASFDVESVVPRNDGTVYYLSTDEGFDVDEVAEDTDGIRLYGDASDGVRAVMVREMTPERRLPQMGARIEEYHVTPEDARLTVVVPDPDGVRSVVQCVQDSYPDASVSVEWGKPDADTDRLTTDPETVLTDRQYEVLEAAYRHGYFDNDSGCNLTELAEKLDISRWTVTQHLQAAQRRLCSHMLE